jgi:two-component system, NtrC family, nitrogen regulation sensor histidine kinase NtrY
MVYKKFYTILVIRILLIALNNLFFFYSIFRLPNFSIIITLGIILVFQVVSLIRYLLKINKKLENFFLIYLSGEITSGNTRSRNNDEFGPMYKYFAEINAKLEKARRENEIQNSYFKTVVDQSAIGLLSFKNNGNVEFLNEAAKKILGVHVLRNIDRLNQVKEGLGDSFRDMNSNEQKLFSFILHGELLQLATRKVRIKVGDEIYNLVSIQNIKQELDEREVESWQKLIRVLTHEIMNSMTPITTLVNTITRLYRNTDDGKTKNLDQITPQAIEKTLKGLDLIESRGQGLIHFVQNYKNVTRIPKPEFKVVNVRELLQRIWLLFEDQATKNGTLVTIDCHPSLNVNADGKLLEQVLINLVKNSVEALEGMQDGRVSMAGYSNNNQVVIEVSDNGRGIPQDLLENIFVPFFTTKEKGSGIGLSLSQQIIRLHGGTMNVESEPNVRTCFTIRLT